MTTDVPASPIPGNMPKAASPAGSSRRRPRRRCDDSSAPCAFGAGLGGEDRAKDVLSDEKAQFLAAQLQESWGGRWQVMWEPWGRKFRAFPACAMHGNTPVEGRSLRELWRAVLDVDQELLLATAETISAHPPTLVNVPPASFRKCSGEQARRGRAGSPARKRGSYATSWRARPADRDVPLVGRAPRRGLTQPSESIHSWPVPPTTRSPLWSPCPAWAASSTRQPTKGHRRCDAFTMAPLRHRYLFANRSPAPAEEALSAGYRSIARTTRIERGDSR